MKQEPVASTWNTHEHTYKGHKILVRTRHLGGKAHIWGINGERVIKTFKSDYNNEKLLLERAKSFIDKNLIIKCLWEKYYT